MSIELKMLAQWEPLSRKYKALGLSLAPQHKQTNKTALNYGLL